MKNVKLTEWQIIAIMESVSKNAELHAASADDLRGLLAKAKSVTVKIEG